MNGTSSTPIYIEVLRSSAEGHVIRWRSGKTRLPAGREVPEALLKAEELMLDLVIDAQLSADGEYQKVVNESAVAAKMADVTKVIMGMFPAGTKELAPIQQMLNPQFFLATATVDIQTYFGMYGIALKPQEKVKAPVTQPFPLKPGMTLTADFSVELVAIDAEKADFKSTTTYDAKELAGRMAEFFAASGIKLPEGTPVPELKMADSGECRFDRKRGLLTRVLAIRQMNMVPGLERTDQREYLLK